MIHHRRMLFILIFVDFHIDIDKDIEQKCQIICDE